MNEIKIGIIGAGEVVKAIHVQGYRECNHVEIRGIASRNKKNAEIVAQAYNIPLVYSNYTELLCDSEINAVSICTPPSTHYDLAKEAIARGKHVLIEKPIATRLDEVVELANLAKKAQVVVQVVRNERFMELHLRVKEIVHSGEMGEVLAIVQSVSTTGPESWAPQANWFRIPSIAGGGALLDLGVHKVDLATWILDQEISDVSKPEVNRYPIEELGALVLKIENKVATIVASWKGPKDESSLQIIGSKGMLTALGSTGDIFVSQDGRIRREKASAPWSSSDHSPKGMILDFIERCLNGQRFTELELKLWDSGTRWVLEAYRKMEE